MPNPRAVAIVGFKGAGKTLVVEGLVRELVSRGYRVGTLKHASQTHTLDTPGKDTTRHRKAGSIASAILTSKNAAVFLDYYLSIDEAVEKLGSVNIVVLEGFKSLDTVSRIIVPRASDEIEALANGLEIALTGPIAGNMTSSSVPVVPLKDFSGLADIVETRAFPLLSGLNCGNCGYDSCKKLAAAILAGEAKIEDCVVQSAGAARLRVNGKQVPMNRFVQDVMRNIVLGVIRTLKGVEKPERFEIIFESEVRKCE